MITAVQAPAGLLAPNHRSHPVVPKAVEHHPFNPCAVEVWRALGRTGGFASSDEVTGGLRRRTLQPISTLARWIVDRRVVSLYWQGEYVLPLFQFHRIDMSLRRAVVDVLDELDGAFEDWDLVAWFALPNDWLDGAAPVDLLDAAPEAVRQAARADRFIARG